MRILPIHKPGVSGVILLSVLGLVALGLCSGCKTATSAIMPATSSGRISEPELREKLAGFYTEYINAFEAATETAAAHTQDVELRRRLIEGRIRAARTCREVVFQRRPMSAFVDTWSLCLRMEGYLASAEGAEQFGEAQPGLIRAARRLREDIESLGKLFLEPKQLAEVKQNLESYAKNHPLSLQHEVSEVTGPSADQQSGIPQLGWLLNVPLSPFRAFEGVDKSAAAVAEVGLAATDIAQTAKDLPRELTWETQLLLLQLRREVEGVLTRIDQSQTNTQGTLERAQLAVAEARGAITELNTSLISGKEAAGKITETITALNTLEGATVSMLKQINDLYPPSPEPATAKPAADAHPFDIRDYTKAAEQLSSAATNLTRLLVEVQGTVAADALTLRIKEAQATITQTETLARSLVNHIALLVLLLVLFSFGALFAYRMVMLRIQKRRDA